MEDTEINEIAERIKKATPIDAVVKYIQHGGGPDESHIIANRAGYLRLATFFLRAAVAPHDKQGSAIVDIDSSDILDDCSDIGISWLERREDFEKFENQETVSDKLSCIGCIVGSFVFFAFFIIGVVTVLNWIF